MVWSAESHAEATSKARADCGENLESTYVTTFRAPCAAVTNGIDGSVAVGWGDSVATATADMLAKCGGGSCDLGGRYCARGPTMNGEVSAWFHVLWWEGGPGWNPYATGDYKVFQSWGGWSWEVNASKNHGTVARVL